MTQSNLQKQAKQGNPQAIATLLNNTLQPKGITAEVSLNQNCLQIIVEANQVPSQDKLVAFLSKAISNLGISSVHKLKIYGQKTGDDFPDWSEEIDLQPSPSTTNQNNYQSYSQNNSISTSINYQKPNNEKSFIDDLKSFDFNDVFPYKDALKAEVYQNNIVKTLIFLGLFPLTISLFLSNLTLQYTAGILGIYYACIWGIILYNLIRPLYFSWADILKCALFTMFIGIPVLFFFQTVPPFTFLYAVKDEIDIIKKLIGFIFGVGLLEEICKALPVYIFMLNTGKLKEPQTASFYGAISGLGFAVYEGINYAVFIYPSIANASLSNYILVTTIRFISLPLIHAIWAGIVGYFIGLAAINPSRKKAIIFIGIAIAAILHGVYDTFAGGFIGLVTVVFSILLFATYLQRSEQIIQKIQATENKNNY